MKNQYLKSWKPVLPGLAAFILLAGILIFPHEAYQSALSGLNIFLQSVFPALLPFLSPLRSLSGWVWLIFCLCCLTL